MSPSVLVIQAGYGRLQQAVRNIEMDAVAKSPLMYTPLHLVQTYHRVFGFLVGRLTKRLRYPE